MNKVANWVFGSFFRTIGRLLVFVLLGIIIAHFVDFGSLIDNFRITDLFFEKVNASSGGFWLGEVSSPTNTWYYSSLSPFYVERQVRTYTTYMSSIQFETNFSQSGVDKFYINGYIGGVNFTNYTTNCTSISGTTYTHCNWQNNLDDFQFQIWLGDNRNQCKIDYNNAMFTTSGNAGYLFWNAECYSDNVSTSNSIGYRLLLQDNIDSSGSGSARDYTFAINRRVYFSASDSQAIVQAQAQTTDAINTQTQQQQQQHNEMMNDTVQDSNETESAFEDFESFLPENGIITQLITLPITLYTNILNSVNASCSAFSLGNIFGKPLTLPCINISNYLGSNLWGVIDILMSGFFVLVIARKLIKVFNSMSSMKEGDVLGD